MEALSAGSRVRTAEHLPKAAGAPVEASALAKTAALPLESNRLRPPHAFGRLFLETVAYFPALQKVEIPVTIVAVSHVTQILNAIDMGDPKGADQLLPLVYEELRKLAAQKMAQERPGQTLQATALVHEAWMRLVGSEEQKVWNSRGHFFGAAAEAMRRILVESARRKARLRHGGQLERVPVEEIEIAEALPEERLVQVSEALEELEDEAPEAAQVVKLRYFAGLTQEQVAGTMGLSLRAAERHWTWAKAWLFRWIREQERK